MRYYEFCLREGAIDVSDIVNEAEESLRILFSKIIKEDAQKWLNIAGIHSNISSNLESIFNKAESEYKKELQKGFTAAWRCMYNAGSMLTDIVQKYLIEKYDAANGIFIDQLYYPIENIKVKITQYEHPKRYKGAMYRDAFGSTFGINNKEISNKYQSNIFCGIVIHIDRKSWLNNFESALLDQMDILCFNNTEIDSNYYIEMMIEMITSTFGHEFDHIIYHIKKQSGIDKSMISAGGIRSKIDNKRKGKKYDNQEYRNNVDIEDARYLSSDAEMQSWATDAATDLIRRYVKFHTKPWAATFNKNLDSDPKIWNSYIDGIIRSIQSGKINITDNLTKYARYFRDKKVKKTDDNDNPIKDENGKDIYIQVNEKEFRKVWQKFLKLLILKLEKYKKNI